MQGLLKHCGGKIVELNSRERFSSVEDVDWERIWGKFLQKRDRFRESYGTFEAAISGANVFPYMRDNNLIQVEFED